MATDFYDAHQRHWEDAELLYGEQRWGNADQLYGYAAECGLKRLMQAFGMLLDSARTRPVNRDDRVHISEAWNRYETYRSGHHSGVNYVLPSGTPFANWDISSRYDNRSGFSQAHVDPHKAAAIDINKLVKKAVLEGII